MNENVDVICENTLNDCDLPKLDLGFRYSPQNESEFKADFKLKQTEDFPVVTPFLPKKIGKSRRNYFQNLTSISIASKFLKKRVIAGQIT